MGKKSFTAAAAAAGTVYGSLIANAQEVQEVQEVHNVPEVQEVHDTQEVHAATVSSTQGRKGQKQQRINMAFTAENLEYLHIMAAMKGVTATQFVNDLITADREKNAATFQAAQDLKRNL